MRSLACALFVLASAISSATGEVEIRGWVLQDEQKVSAPGEQLSQSDFSPASWIPAVVPGTVLTSLVAAGIYPEPLYGENNRSIPEGLCRTSYWYRSTFEVPRSYQGRHLWLNFDGINYKARVWVDGHKIGDIDGAFARGTFDITSAVSPGRRAAVAVLILPPAHPGNPQEQTQAAGTGRNGGDLGADGPTFEATVGWDWIPGIRDRDMGLWQRVYLSQTGPVRIDNPYIVTDLPRTDSASLTVQATLTNLESGPATGTLEGSVPGSNVHFEIPVTLAAGESRLISLTPQHTAGLTMNHPRLWWPNGYGPQNLYRLKLRFTSGSVSDSTETQFGVRTIKYFEAPGSDMKLVVNGVPVFAKGGNWGMDEAMKRSPKDRLEAQLRLHHDANCTMIRNWIGMSTQEDFYDACDKYGILVWDDFWLANPVDGPNPVDPQLFIANAREKILRFRNHPSIAVWCGRNEGNPPPNIEPALEAMTHDFDPQRFYQKHSSYGNGVSGGGPYSFLVPAAYFRMNRPRDYFHTEMGAPSIPTLQALEAMMPKKDWWPINDDWAEHDFCSGAQAGDAYPGAIGRRYGEVAGLEDFVRKGQMATYEGYRAIFESRNAKLFDPYTGILLWMSNPSQPSFVWQLYTHDLEPNAAEFATMKACEPIHVQMDPAGNVQAINNLPAPIHGATLLEDVRDLKGRPLGRHEAKVNIPGSCATKVEQIDWPQGGDDVVLVKLTLLDSSHKKLSDNFYWASKSGSNDFSVLGSIPTAGLEVRAFRLGSGTVKIDLRNPTPFPALLAHVQLRRAKTGERVLPVFYSDNYVSLLPGESKAITAEFSIRDLNRQDPVIAVDGFNVKA